MRKKIRIVETSEGAALTDGEQVVPISQGTVECLAECQSEAEVKEVLRLRMEMGVL